MIKKKVKYTVERALDIIEAFELNYGLETPYEYLAQWDKEEPLHKLYPRVHFLVLKILFPDFDQNSSKNRKPTGRQRARQCWLDGLTIREAAVRTELTISSIRGYGFDWNLCVSSRKSASGIEAGETEEDKYYLEEFKKHRAKIEAERIERKNKPLVL